MITYIRTKYKKINKKKGTISTLIGSTQKKFLNRRKHGGPNTFYPETYLDLVLHEFYKSI